MSKMAVMIGGTFNPVTRAHLQMGIEAAKRYPEADILFVPSNMEFISDWKDVESDGVFGDPNRVRLLEEVVKPFGFCVCTVEAQGLVNGTTYETVRFLKEQGYERVVVCIGCDKLEELDRWYRAGDLLAEAEFLLFARDGQKSDRFPAVELGEEFFGVSSTRIRDAYRDGNWEIIRDLSPEQIIQYLWRCRMEQFDVRKVTGDVVEWIREFFRQNGEGCNAVLGISGGKDSSVAAALCVAALGKERVIGVLMPNGEQADIDMSRLLVNHLGIRSYVINIRDSVDGVLAQMEKAGLNPTEQTRINLPARIRMSTVYAVSQSQNGRVVNTCNLSEDWVGYSTRYGDAAGDFSPMAQLTVGEVREIGRELGLPEVLVEKVPSDGLCGKTDEDNLGFTYDALDRYIRTGVCEDAKVKERIDTLHERNKFKLELMPGFPYNPA